MRKPFYLGSELYSAYIDYYREILENNNDSWLLTLFPYNFNNYIIEFSFKRFNIGLVCRLSFPRMYWYGEPANWMINHLFVLDEDKKLLKESCQYSFR